MAEERAKKMSVTEAPLKPRGSLLTICRRGQVNHPIMQVKIIQEALQCMFTIAMIFPPNSMKTLGLIIISI